MQSQPTNQINNLSLAETIAYRNGGEANAFLVAKGVPSSRTADELAFKIARYIVKNGDSGLADMVAIHPDRALILENVVIAPEEKANIQGSNFMKDKFNNCSGNNGSYNNCSGCGGTCGANKGYSNVNGNNLPQQAQPLQLVSKEGALTALAMVAMIGIFAITMIKNKN